MIRAINDSIVKYDMLLLLYIAQFNGRRFTDKFFYLISKSGDGPLYIFAGLIIIFSPIDGGLRIVLSGLLAFAIELPVYFLVKRYVKRLRPFEKMENIKHLIAPPDKYSFPSGHTAAAFVMAMIFSFQFPVTKPWLYLFASLIGFSRLYLRVHYPTDILAGVFLGMISANISLWIIF